MIEYCERLNQLFYDLYAISCLTNYFGLTIIHCHHNSLHREYFSKGKLYIYIYVNFLKSTKC